MFIVSALLGEALKPSTPLTNGTINENKLIFDELNWHTKIMPSFWATLM